MSLFCIAVPPDRDTTSFTVWLADGIAPGVLLASVDTLEEANRICTMLAIHYRIKARTIRK